MQSRQIWRPLLVLATVVTFGLMLWFYWPLKPGIDLRGGTTLVYEVNIGPGQNARQVLDDTIHVLQKRVDPTGVRNLIWRPVGNNRIEIQMARASGKADALRMQTDELRKALLSGGGAALKQQLDTAADLPTADREARLKELAGGSAENLAKFQEYLQAVQASTAADRELEPLEKKVAELDTQIHKLTAAAATQAGSATTKPTTEPAEVKSLRRELEQLVTALEPKVAASAAASTRLDTATTAVTHVGITAGEIDRIEKSSNERGAKDEPSQREAAAAQLIKAHPDQAKVIKDYLAAYASYEKVKGELDDPNDLIAMLKGSGVLEFRIAPTPAAVPTAASFRDELHNQGPRLGRDQRYRWVELDEPNKVIDDIVRHAAEEPGVTSKELDDLRLNSEKQMRDNTALFFAQRGLIGDKFADHYYVLLGNTHETSITRADGDWKLTNASQTTDQRSGFPAVAFQLDTLGGSLMRQLTQAHVNQPMGIVLDNRLISWPVINEAIGGSGQISGGSGGFTPKELEYLIQTLKAGSLQGSLSAAPISIQKTGPQLGEENLKAGLRAVIWSLIIVGGFMMAYYLWWGAVANFALILNLEIILGLMAALSATFTLPGIAGIVLTIGMAVDANVLIFERIREELERKNPIKTSIRLGYEKALATIIDANATTLISCVILGYVASADIKGFAITLGIGLVANVFTAVFCSRVVTDLYVEIVKPQTLPMLPMLIPGLRRLLSPNIDWYGKRHIFWGISAAIAIPGLLGLYWRGQDFLDIEFRSGTQITFQTAADPNSRTGHKLLTIEDIKSALDKEAVKTGEDLLRSDRATVVTVGDTVNQNGRIYASSFSIATLAGTSEPKVVLTDQNKVSDAIKDAFHDVLDTPPALTFAKDGGKDVNKEAPALSASPVYPIRVPRLEANIGRTESSGNHQVPGYVGGVAVVVSDLSQPMTRKAILDRVERMRNQPGYSSITLSTPPEVIGLEAAGSSATTQPAAQAGGEPLYKSVAVLFKDESVNYATNASAFLDPNGTAANVWKLTRDAMHYEASLDSVNNYSPQVSRTMVQQAITAVVLSWLAIMAYIWIRFGNLRYGIGAIIAVIHDVITAVGLAALCAFIPEWLAGPLKLQPFHVNLALVASVLTLIGYSVNDTIVVFDRIRENRGKLAFANRAIINDSINQTISRTILTAFTVFLSVMILYILGGESIRGFAFIMLVGTIVGCYSSIAVAAPILLVGIPHADVPQAPPTAGRMENPKLPAAPPIPGPTR